MGSSQGFISETKLQNLEALNSIKRFSKDIESFRFFKIQDISAHAKSRHWNLNTF